MDYCEVRSRLQYVSELLEDLRHFHYSNTHACKCDVCLNKAALLKSSIAKALEEVSSVVLILETGTLKDVNMSSNEISSSLIGSPQRQILTPAEMEHVCTNLKKDNSTVEKKLTSDSNSLRLSEQCTSLFSSTQRDSGMHTLLNSQSISPILDSHEVTTEEITTPPVLPYLKTNNPLSVHSTKAINQQESVPVMQPYLSNSQTPTATPTNNAGAQSQPYYPVCPMFHSQATPTSPFPCVWPSPSMQMTPQHNMWTPNMFMPFPFMPYMPSPSMFQETCRRFSENFARSSELLSSSECREDIRNQTFSYFPYTPPSVYGKASSINPSALTPHNIPAPNSNAQPNPNFGSTPLSGINQEPVSVQTHKKSPVILFENNSIGKTSKPTTISSSEDGGMANDLIQIEKDLVGMTLTKVEDYQSLTSSTENVLNDCNKVVKDVNLTNSDKLLINENHSCQDLDKTKYQPEDPIIQKTYEDFKSEGFPLDIDDPMWRPWETQFNIMQLIGSDHSDSFSANLKDMNISGVETLPKPTEETKTENSDKNNTSTPESNDVAQDDAFSVKKASEETGADTANKDTNNISIIEVKSPLADMTVHKSNKLKDCRESADEIHFKLKENSPSQLKKKSEERKSPKHDINYSLTTKLTQKEKKEQQSKPVLNEIPVTLNMSSTYLSRSLKETLVSPIHDNEKPAHVKNKENESVRSVSPHKSKSSPNKNSNTNNMSSLKQNNIKSQKNVSSSGATPKETMSVRTSNKTLNVSKSSPPMSYKKVQWGAPAILTKKSSSSNKSDGVSVLENAQKPKKVEASPRLVDKRKSGKIVHENSKHILKDDSSARQTITGKADKWKTDRPMKTASATLNKSLPASCYSQDPTRKLSAVPLINDSYEANQSFPKITKSAVSSTAITSKKEQEVGKNLHQIGTPVIETKPRNRRSIFGVSPPESHSGLQGKEKGCQESESDSSLSGHRSTLESLESVFIKRVWEHLDATGELGLVPSIQEVLFNCVTSSICVVNSARGGKIVSLNESFQFLIGVHEKVIGQRLFRFIKVKDSLENLGQSVSQSFVLADGRLTQVSGKLLVCIDARGVEIPVIVWTVPFSPQPHLTVCVVETTVSTTADIYLSCSGNTLMSCSMQDLLGYDRGVSIITKTVDTFRLDFSLINKQQPTTVESVDGETLPVTIILFDNPAMDPELDELMFPAQLSVSLFKAGLVMVDANGTIQSYDQRFFLVNFGFNKADNMAQHKLSEFLSDVIKIGDNVHPGKNVSPSQEADAVGISLGDVSRLQNGDDGQDNDGLNLSLPKLCFLSQDDDEESDDEETSLQEDAGGKEECGERYSVVPSVSPYQTSTPCKPVSSAVKTFTSLKLNKETELSNVRMDNGIYYSLFLHENGNKIPVTFKLSRLQVTDRPTLFCLWFCLQSSNSDPEDEELTGDEEDGDSFNEAEDLQYDEEETESMCEYDRTMFELQHLRLDCSGHSNAVDASLGQMIADQAALNQSCNASMNISHNAASDEDRLDLESAIAGKFTSKYVVGEALGQGSFGFVRRAKRKDSQTTCVVKFIKKSKMFEDSWTYHEVFKKVPLEVAILSTVSCDHIIKLLAVYENQHFIQMVMEDFGEIDLFDFIDLVPIDEPLACHLFKQIVQAVDYLHSNSIVHRDIKDENVVVNNSFHCKLIDFGSASYMLPSGVKFTKFRGTREYCSPEVHNGEGYYGPELDIWALGVTLFTIVFQENPFTVESGPYELTASELPYPISEDLATLLFGLLQVNPRQRYSMQEINTSEWLLQEVDMSCYKWEEMLGARVDEVDVVNLTC
ncbi:uncharacterized protein LOC106056299 [Biomphalaria glabrata]|uniref:Uncharacterized protein LOC106056299 n=1 Tax=Biomphalaria glabrata TaxID=6526 RepID=A0A9W2Z8D6_BIOGL|nr:uncharacterized protein LOC106056299 [Biomphalaria glabrata]